MLRFKAISQKTKKTILPNNYASELNLIKALKENNIPLTRDILIKSFEEMNCNGSDGRNTSRGKQFLSRKQKNHSTRRNLR
tara:strand:+ start:810 stop:1052 length:243 start_codon:yes stop_codon:yes gene_type:complete